MTRTSGDDERTIGVLDPTTPGIALDSRRAELAHGAHVGRYMVIKSLGRGGMGIVYAAHDTKLDRQVALKILHSSHAAGEGADHVVREAQALARLSDPHVVQVFDAGELDGQVYLAMQLVDGEDLATAIRRKQSVAQIVAWFVAAGRGLAAAHAAGLVHRDFKPSNVLIDRSGQVAVTDFGLARSTAPDSSGNTGLGVIMGTPAYMSPEQHGMLPATPASDQFSFCVALWEALFATHPFIAGDRGSMSPFAIGFAIYDGNILPPPKGARVPRRVIDALTRGLAHEPADRWPSMEALLAELAPISKRRAWPTVVVACTIAAGVTGAGVYLVSRDREGDWPRCERDAAARLGGAWSPELAQQLHDRFAATGRSFADAAARAARAGLDRYATRWTQLAGDVCSAERATGSARAPELVVRRRACLDMRLDALRGVVGLLASDRADAFVDRAQAMIDGMPDLGDCGDAASLLAAPTPPAGIAVQVTELERDIANASARGKGGEFQRARGELRDLAARADQLGWGPTRARARLALGNQELAMIEPARADLLQAAELATEHHLDRDAARAWSLATQAAAMERSPDGVAALGAVARASAARTHDRVLELDARVRLARATVRLHKWQDGATACRAAYAAAHEVDSPQQLSAARDCLVEALVPLGAYGELEPLLDAAVAETARQLGPDHPTVSDYMGIQVGIALRRGKLADARKLAERVLAMREKAYPAGHSKIAEALRELAEVTQAEDKKTDALALYEKALAITDETRPDQLVLIASLETNIAMLEQELDRHADALAHFARAVALVRQKSGDDSLELAILLLNYGQIRSADNLDDGLGLIKQGRAILERVHDKRATAAGIAIAIVQVNGKRWADAAKTAEDVLAKLGKDDDADAEMFAEAKWMLARSLGELHRDRPRATTLAREARALYAKLGPAHASQVKTIDDWLAKR